MDITRPTLALISGRLVGAVATFAIPLVLVRVFTVEEFATYRQLFLIFGTLVLLLQFGLAESLYYFVPREGEAGGRFAANTVVALAALGGAAALAGVWVAPAIARWWNNAALEPLLPLLAVFLALMVTTVGLEIVMITRRRYALAAVTYAVSDAVRAAALLLPAVLLGSVRALLVGAIAAGLFRLVWLIAYLRREFGGSLRPHRPSWVAQLAYTLPFGAAVTIEILQFNYHQYAVASWFDPATFAIYSVACLQIPLVELLGTSAINVMMVAMADPGADTRTRLSLWHATVSRLAVMFLPLVGLVLLVARDLITLLYTDAFAAAAPIFMLSMAFIVMYAIPVDGALRVFARTRFILGMNIFRLVFIAAAIGAFVSAFGLIGAMLVTVIATACVKVAALWRISRLLGVPAVAVLPWRPLAATTAAVLVALVPAAVVHAALALPALLHLTVVGLVFGVTYLALLALAHARPALRAIVPQEERAR